MNPSIYEVTAIGKGSLYVMPKPDRDHRLPEDKEFFELINNLYQSLLDGKNIAIHCRAGVVRTRVTACCILLEDGYFGKTVIDMVSAARNYPIPDTDEQYQFIWRFERIQERKRKHTCQH